MDNQNSFAAQELRSCLYNPNNWDNTMDQNDIFESALSSMVSSPVTSNGGGGGGGGENIVLRELIGRLGSICNSGEMSPHSYNINVNTNNNSTTNSCYSTPLNSPPKLNLSIMDHQIRGNLPISASHLAPHHQGFVAPFPSDPGFAERAARYSCFASKNLSGQIGMNNDADFGQRLVPKLDSGKISRVSSNHSIKIPGSQLDSDRKLSKFSRSSTPENSEFGDSMEISSLTEQITAGENVMNAPSEANPRKRKPVPKGKAKEPTSLNVGSENTDTNAKRSKSEEDNTEEKDGTKEEAESYGTDKSAGDGNKKQSKDNNAKPPEAPKDYIHVRARRGQATDAHSLAERVRREKISERMKLLQDLVPGCNKVTGKAVMLDEIINYVQSLQRQVEFLSMKLSTIHPRSDFNAEAHLSKDVVQSQGPLQHNMYQSAASATEFPYPLYQLQGTNAQNAVPNGADMLYTMNHLNNSTGRNAGMQLLPSDNFGEAPPQVQGFWGDDLQSLVQMGIGPNQAQDFHGIMSTGQMKVEQ